ncbi:hypothetical protein [Leptospira kirschneri]|uniref:hypothetical protein n=1 Tax=Leptospira kirschneri TaxID=29507 RepID=UPI0002F3E492|nr:hypothetical protein [Leptospira kirschneri]EPG49656.1 hypothetical protein LEP1GSC049_1091 [Leptospira kirschneri serovar Cynopteri str. 3522 CT]
MYLILSTVKIGAVLFWIVFSALLFGFISVESHLSFLIKAVGYGTLAVHLLEIVYFWFLLRKKSNNIFLDCIQILIFGVFHMISLRNKRA